MMIYGRGPRRLAYDPSTRGDGFLARFSAGIWNPRGYINQPARAAGQPAHAGGWNRRLP